MSNSIGQPSPAFPSTTAAVVSQWYEVAASFDSRPDIPRNMAVCAHDEDGNPSPFHTSTCIEIELPGGFVIPLDFVAIQNVQRIDFPVRWRISKPETLVPLQFVVFGVGVTAGGAE